MGNCLHASSTRVDHAQSSLQPSGEMFQSCFLLNVIELVADVRNDNLWWVFMGFLCFSLLALDKLLHGSFEVGLSKILCFLWDF